MIDSFKQPPYEFLSNMYPCEIHYLGHVFDSTEAAYQAMKFDSDLWPKFIGIDGYTAKRLSKSFPVDADRHYKNRVKVMRELLDLKFAFGSELAERLLDTGDEEIVEGNTWGDTFWGVCDGVGQNKLGELLMERRDALNEMWEEVIQ